MPKQTASQKNESFMLNEEDKNDDDFPDILGQIVQEEREMQKNKQQSEDISEASGKSKQSKTEKA